MLVMGTGWDTGANYRANCSLGWSESGRKNKEQSERFGI